MLSTVKTTPINIGSWGLHVVHGAFKTDFQSVDWDLLIKAKDQRTKNLRKSSHKIAYSHQQFTSEEKLLQRGKKKFRVILLPYLWTLYWNCKNVVLWSQWWSEKLPVCHLLIWQNSLKYLLQNLNILLINYSKKSISLQNRKMELRFSMMIFSNLLLVKIFQVLRSLIFLIFDMTSLSANICTETTSTNVYWRCASLFSQCFMGKVLWREPSISTNICWFKICVKYLQEVRDWSMIISSCLM